MKLCSLTQISEVGWFDREQYRGEGGFERLRSVVCLSASPVHRQ